MLFSAHKEEFNTTTFTQQQMSVFKLTLNNNIDRDNYQYRLIWSILSWYHCSFVRHYYFNSHSIIYNFVTALFQRQEESTQHTKTPPWLVPFIHKLNLFMLIIIQIMNKSWMKHSKAFIYNLSIILEESFSRKWYPCLLSFNI